MAKVKKPGPKMSEEVKARLREVQKAKKQIATLAGYERSGLMACADAVLEGRVVAYSPYIKEADPHAVHVNANSAGVGFGDSLQSLGLRWVFAYSEPTWDRKKVRWVRFKRAPQDFLDTLKAVFPHAEVEERMFAGPGSTKKVRVTLFAADLAFSLIRAMWPNDWAARIPKNCVGYTAAAVANLQKKETDK